MDILLLSIIIVVALALFATEVLPIDVVALIVLATLFLTGLVNAEQALAGFSNTATVTIAAMFILSYGLEKTGAIRYAGERIIQWSRGNAVILFLLFLPMVSIISAFINNTAAVAIFLPLALKFSKEFQFSPSRILMPLSFAAIFGGTMTVIGTSTNILVSAIAQEHGLGSFWMFELLPLGAIFLVAGLAYIFVFNRLLLPVRSSQRSLTGKYHLTRYLTELQVSENSTLNNTTIFLSGVLESYDVYYLAILRGKQKILIDIKRTLIQAGDILLVRGTFEEILRLKEREKMLLLTDVKLNDEELSVGDNVLTEVLIPPTSSLVESTLRDVNFRDKYGCFVLAIRHHGETERQKIANLPLRPSDTLLIYGSKRRVTALDDGKNFIVLKEVDIALPHGKRWMIAVGTILAVIILAAFNIVSILQAAIVGSLVLVLSRTITMPEAYRSVDWSVIMLLAGVIPIGAAMENTGLARMLGESVATYGGPFGPTMVVALFYLVTSVLTELMSNNSAAIVLAPIAISTAQSLGISPMPLLMAVTFAASASFMTPVGYQTNAMVYGPGGYKYTDYFRFGAPLNLLFLIIATIFIPVIWPF